MSGSIGNVQGMKFDVGQTVGGYEFLDLLDSSPTGVTYRVRNVLVKRLEVLKVLPKELQEDQKRVDRFLREVNIRARLTHPNIVGFYNAMPLEDQLVMTTELVEGPTLEDVIGRGPIPLKESVDYVCQALSALVYAHAQGVVHRDIRPSSMIITSSGKLKLGDFGLAKMYADPQLTQPGTVLGTVYYTAPEQVKGVTDLDERVDVYSIGVVLYELLTGQKPFASKSHFEVMQAHVQTQPRPPNELQDTLSGDLSDVVVKALAKEPADRFASAMRFRSVLQTVPLTLIEGREQQIAAMGRPKDPPPPPPPPPAPPAVSAVDESEALAVTDPLSFDSGPPAPLEPQAHREADLSALQTGLTQPPGPGREKPPTPMDQSTMQLQQMRKVAGTDASRRLPELPVDLDDRRAPKPGGDADILLIAAVTFVGVALLFFAFLTLAE